VAAHFVEKLSGGMRNGKPERAAEQSHELWTIRRRSRAAGSSKHGPDRRECGTLARSSRGKAGQATLTD